jgi:hypothetical protein
VKKELESAKASMTKISLIETVARAICEADENDPDNYWEEFEPLAIAAIKAIKEFVEAK